ncbi:MAG: AraC family transcriptional regulator [Gammaproteobacteria bacterium]|nr:AraC family transcriptional regulator [Gammaproteobacteria bacterium]
MLRLYRELQEECERGAPESSELVRSLLLLLLGEVRRAMPGGETTAPTGSLVADALEFIQRRCLDPISLKDVAAAVHRTPAHVAFTVKKFTSHSVGEWLRAGRVAEAAARLAHTEDSIDEITNHVGWQDKTHFIRQFRKSHGATPAAWRRQHRAKHLGDAD